MKNIPPTTRTPSCCEINSFNCQQGRNCPCRMQDLQQPAHYVMRWYDIALAIWIVYAAIWFASFVVTP